MFWSVDLKRESRPIDCCKLYLMGHRWPKDMLIWKFWIQSDFYVHIRIGLINNTFLVIARSSRTNKQRACKPSAHLAFSWHTSKLSSLILWNARVTVSQSCSCLERVHPVGGCAGWTRSKQETLWLTVTRLFHRVRSWSLVCVMTRPNWHLVCTRVAYLVD